MGAKWADVMGAFPPGRLVREELEARGWTQQELANKIGRPVQAISMIVNGRKAITAETAMQLQEAFGASASMWMGLEADWQLYKESEKQKTAERLMKGIRSHPAKVACVAGLTKVRVARRRPQEFSRHNFQEAYSPADVEGSQKDPASKYPAQNAFHAQMIGDF